ncbi:MAG: ribosome-associated translation inhibitor RaiA [Bifidobacteriaceae bacterium]|nr:ribosome-associated translation inhibitor RaiA [Bifidobacteriaceae bacterium]
MQIEFFARNTKLSTLFKDRVVEKLSKFDKIEALDSIKVELEYFSNPSIQQHSMKVELTAPIKGELLRAEASEANEFKALDTVIGKFSERLRRELDKQKSKNSGR